VVVADRGAVLGWLMFLSSCKLCGYACSYDAKACPNCGQPWPAQGNPWPKRIKNTFLEASGYLFLAFGAVVLYYFIKLIWLTS
jgi:hypothetical protein